MKLSAAYGPGKFGLSFELFPPKTPQGVSNLFQHVNRLVEFSPSFVTCTYGAGGSTQELTLEIVARVHREFQLPVATHLTCVGRTVDELRQYLRSAGELNVQNVVALRGDPPRGDATFRPVEGGFRYANQLVELIHNEFRGVGIAVAGYPEKHQEAATPEIDLANLKRKVEAGADVVITQLFYNNDDFFRFRDDCHTLGIRVPIVPGLLPVTNFAQIKRITSLCGAQLPTQFVERLEAAGDAADEQFRIGVEFATRQSQQLVDAGVPGIHYYVLNRSEAAAEVLSNVDFAKKR
ncbi:MAG TPA: methylenetetrahydrofolate reductase [NAD(P)H] [Lacipirellulaceae bacterium]|jgi:methylenetetrahydrofolate reductase (NADPH)|nr:methylenetetrahydrofolate reductase [NAD(P)H] [Lacipirellulaceae bacterium]